MKDYYIKIRSTATRRGRRALGWSFVAYVALFTTQSTSAHHSGSMFDSAKLLTLAGTVREFQFTNPHCYIQLVVPDPTGTPVEWSIEMGAPAHLFRSGWKPTTLKPGDAITVTLKPLRDGGKGGEFKSAIWADGKPVGGQP